MCSLCFLLDGSCCDGCLRSKWTVTQSTAYEVSPELKVCLIPLSLSLSTSSHSFLSASSFSFLFSFLLFLLFLAFVSSFLFSVTWQHFKMREKRTDEGPKKKQEMRDSKSSTQVASLISMEAAQWRRPTVQECWVGGSFAFVSDPVFFWLLVFCLDLRWAFSHHNHHHPRCFSFVEGLVLNFAFCESPLL
jgi:hypothetical protein